MASPTIDQSSFSERIERLQIPIKELLDLGDELYDQGSDWAPRPVEDSTSPVTHINVMDGSLSVPLIGELSVSLPSDDRHIRVDRNLPAHRVPKGEPRRRLWYTRPSDNGFDLVTNPFEIEGSRKPFNIESAFYNERGICQGFLDPFLEDHETVIEDTRRALLEAIDYVRNLRA